MTISTTEWARIDMDGLEDALARHDWETAWHWLRELERHVSELLELLPPTSGDYASCPIVRDMDESRTDIQEAYL